MKNMQKKILITLAIGLVLIIGFYIITDAITKYTGFFVFDDKNDFEKCLEQQDIALFINTEDSTRSLKNIQLIDYLQYVNITNCLRNNEACLEKGVHSFPSWIINNRKIEKDISFEELSEFSRCRFIK